MTAPMSIPPMIRTDYVHIHAGIHGFNPEGDVSSLNPAVSDWNNPVAKITIQRIYY